MSAHHTRRALLAGAAAAPLAALPAVAAPLHPNDAALLRLEQAIVAVAAEQDRLGVEDDAPVLSAPRRAAIRARLDALSADWHATLDDIIDTPAASDIGRQAKARVLLRWTQRDRDGWPTPDDALPWSLARDVLGIADGPARVEGDA
ncbi:MAG: hypothetical protein M0Z28_11465 [Rhodospirillales bacterium]|nr:hypothetical protein [Rhodospirillales bacterium]